MKPNEDKVIINNKKQFVSARAFIFLYQNTLKVDPWLDLSQFEEIIAKGAVGDLDKIPKIEFEVISDFIRKCLDTGFSQDDFYRVGNKMHEFHFSLMSMLFKLNTDFAIPIKNDVSFFRMNFKLEKDKFILHLNIDEVLVLNKKEIFAPVLNIMHGFIDRLLKTFLNNKPVAVQTDSSLELTYRQRFVSTFDIAQYISNEEFFFSRLKNNMLNWKEEGFKPQVQFFLFKDISFSIEEIAGKMNLTVRALQRKLKIEESSFRNIKENVRRELSRKYLSDLSLSIQEVSELLAYSERSVFEKAFKKWYGENPKVFREK